MFGKERAHMSNQKQVALSFKFHFRTLILLTIFQLTFFAILFIFFLHHIEDVIFNLKASSEKDNFLYVEYYSEYPLVVST